MFTAVSPNYFSKMYFLFSYNILLCSSNVCWMWTLIWLPILRPTFFIFVRTLRIYRVMYDSKFKFKEALRTRIWEYFILRVRDWGWIPNPSTLRWLLEPRVTRFGATRRLRTKRAARKTSAPRVRWTVDFNRPALGRSGLSDYSE